MLAFDFDFGLEFVVRIDRIGADTEYKTLSSGNTGPALVLHPSKLQASTVA